MDDIDYAAQTEPLPITAPTKNEVVVARLLWFVFLASLISFSALSWILLSKYGALVPIEDRWSKIDETYSKQQVNELLGEPDKILNSESEIKDLLSMMTLFPAPGQEHWLYVQDRRQKTGRIAFRLIWQDEKLIAKYPNAKMQPTPAEE